MTTLTAPPIPVQTPSLDCYHPAPVQHVAPTCDLTDICHLRRVCDLCWSLSTTHIVTTWIGGMGYIARDECCSADECDARVAVLCGTCHESTCICDRDGWR